MLQTLTPQHLSSSIAAEQLGFNDTSELQGPAPGWIGQAQARQAAAFGLGLDAPGFHLLVVGEPGSGRTSLMLALMREFAARRPAAPDLVYLYNFDVPEKPQAIYLKAGGGVELRNGLEQCIRQFAKSLPLLLQDATAQYGAGVSPEAAADRATGGISLAARQQISEFWQTCLGRLRTHLAAWLLDGATFEAYTHALQQDVLDNLELVHPSAENEEALEDIFGRYRANLLVDNRQYQAAPAAPVIYDDDPSLQSLFGGMEGDAEHSANAADFMRLRAGNLLRANGGMLLMHLRDIQSDQHGSHQLLEKLHRFLRNERLQIECASGSGHGAGALPGAEPLEAKVKVVLIAGRDEYYQLQEDRPDLAGYFRIKVEFNDHFSASAEHCQAVAAFIAARCRYFGLPHFSAAAVAALLQYQQRLAADQTHLSSDFCRLQQLLLECAAVARAHRGPLVEAADVTAAIAAQYTRHQYPEQQLRDSILNGELMIRLQGREIGQINGLTHVDLGEASFGSPVRISARCYAGDQGIINIGREVEMSGPNHDKGVFILQSWLSASFRRLTPLALNATLVFEQEYHGVEGDSASCAELYALLSALSELPLPQGVAVTGALNQHGEVMPIGGINEKIEGYFRVCQQFGLDGMQGVLIPARNMPHLMLSGEVIEAVAQRRFHIHAISHVLEGIEYLTGMSAGQPDANGDYRGESVLGRAQRTLEQFRAVYEQQARMLRQRQRH